MYNVCFVNLFISIYELGLARIKLGNIYNFVSNYDERNENMQRIEKIPQDLHIHTIFSNYDSMVVPEQTLELISHVKHAKIIGISDHFESLHGNSFELYRSAVRSFGFYLGTEVDGSDWAKEAIKYPFDYFLYHCRDKRSEYKGAEKLLETGKPVIISHPAFMGTNLSKVPPKCYVEINNRYVWRTDWRNFHAPYLNNFKWIINSDAHQPWMLNQVMARFVASELGITETILF